jgi:hypothetical protein
MTLLVLLPPPHSILAIYKILLIMLLSNPTIPLIIRIQPNGPQRPIPQRRYSKARHT